MRLLASALSIVALFASATFAAQGDQWILGIHHINNEGTFTAVPGVGYNGPQSSGHPSYVGNAYGRSGKDGVARVYWELSGSSIVGNRTVPTSTELYTIEYFGVANPNGGHDFQPIESQFHGIVGEDYPTDPHIPWNGAFGTNHQHIKSNHYPLVGGAWNATGPGTQAPSSAAPGASPNGNYMWLTSGSWLYAKWDFGFNVSRNWSAIRLTQITGEAPPLPPTGDFNSDNVVDAADYVVWRKGLPSADANGDTIIDEYDYFLWVENFGMTASGSGAATNVPEPVGVALCLAAVLGLAAFSGRGRRP